MYYVMIYATFEGWATMYQFRDRNEAISKAKEIAPDVENVMVVQLVIDGEALRVHEVSSLADISKERIIMSDIDHQIAALPTGSFWDAAIQWRLHDCESESDCCTCLFQFGCTKCGRSQVVSGEDMPDMIDAIGECNNCRHGVANA